jgi:tripartite-type tricarboxylate transporter receptor subunit TctC
VAANFQSLVTRATRVALGTILALAAASVVAQDYPNKAIRLVAPASVGSTTDLAARLLAEGLSRKLGQPVVVDNRPGANTAIGTAIAAKSPADGYTLAMIFVDNMSLNPAIRNDLGYKPSDLDPVAIVGQVPLVILGAAHLPYSSMGELKAAAMQGKKGLSFGTWGNGSVAHVVGVMLDENKLFNFNFVPYPGSAPSTTAVMGGHVDLAVASSGVAEKAVGSTKVKALAVFSTKRLPTLPNVPTLAEAGFGDMHATQWHGLAVRAGGDKKIITRLQDAVASLYAEPETRQRFLKLGYVDVGGMSAAEFKRFIDATSSIWARAVKAGNITAE